ncbi:GNAT family N-acetyltransferase [Flexibacterium corallicola]|uniref:GNAT family N-acetyltransferase n=1 Tax=Flexibacterium corallicola TaxID=3037259 RepID=UPI00286EF23A|nr:GNAT family N-acetyltransferase [Pseudovibrio sp. M1P-2-3]
MKISTDKSLFDLDLIFNFLSKRAYWSQNLPRDIFEKAIANSFCFGAFDDTGKQVGFARLVTDYATFGYLADVFIDESARGKGISKLLMAAIMDHPQLQNIRRMNLATRDAHGLYEQFGFQSLDKPEIYMERVDQDIYNRLMEQSQSACT